MNKTKAWKPIDLKKVIGKRNMWQLPLEELLTVVDQLFPTANEVTTSCYNYSLNRFPYGWVLKVVNDWYQWSDKKLKHDFGAFQKPEFALAAFLEYCIQNNIQPHKLYES